jgi:regulatory protein
MRKRPAKKGEQKQLTPEESRQRTFARAVKLLSAKPRSVAELRERLLEKRWVSKKDVEDAIDRLKEYGYLDDERFALGYASLRIRERPLGRNRLARDLHFKKVDRAVAEEALELVFTETPEEELIDRAVEKRIRLRGKPTNAIETKRLFDHLLRLGFPFDLVREKVRGLGQADVDEES